MKSKKLALLHKEYAIALTRMKEAKSDSEFLKCLKIFHLLRDEIINLQNCES